MKIYLGHIDIWHAKSEKHCLILKNLVSIEHFELAIGSTRLYGKSKDLFECRGRSFKLID
jgi:hypothetical protein